MSNTDNQVTEEVKSKGFQRSQLTNVVEVKLMMPVLYPSTREKPFTIYMRLQLVREAEELQSKFLTLSDDEQEAGTHEYDAQMISTLSVKPPSGFDDFPVVDNDPETLKKAIYEYLIFAEGSTEEREGLAHICRHLISRYRRTVNPTEYL